MGFDPLTMGIIGGIGSVVSGIGQYNAANYQSQVAANNAQIAAENAKRAVEAADIQATNQGLKNRGTLGAIKAAQAGNNIDVNSGSAAKVQQSQAELGQLDQLTIRNRGKVEQYGYEGQQMAYQAQSKLDQMQGQTALTSSLLSGASSVGKGWTQQNMYVGSQYDPSWSNTVVY